MSRAVASGSGSWLHHLPFVLLGMRSAVREDSQCSPADLVFGAPLPLPGDMLVPSGPTPLASDFSARLRSVMNAAVPMPVSYHGSQRSRLDPALQSASHVFLRVDAVRRPLVPPYQGPFLVLRRGPKTFDLLQKGKTVTVTVDRLKPAHLLPADLPLDAVPRPSTAVDPSAGVSAAVGPVVDAENAFPVVAAGTSDSVVDTGVSVPPSRSRIRAPGRPPAQGCPPTLDPEVWPLPTRYGRRPRPPDRLNL